MSKQFPSFASQETKDKLRLRDLAVIQMKRTYDADDICQYKTLRNLCHKLLRKDKEQSIMGKFKEAEGNSKKQWTMTKN